MSISARLPVFPWDRLEPYKATAAAHADGIVDLSVGTPVDPVPDVVREALAASSDSPGYPLTYGTAALREAVAGYLRRWHGVSGADPRHVLPLIGSKELVGWLPTLLDLREGDQVGYPQLAYPTYEIGALIARAEPVAYDDPVTGLDPARTRMLWLNSPSNPTGRVLPA
ncbi:MAG: aminotransferase class I/II-fold pyridoxal phosphate-dependent enzyme, partial [Actinomycetia bacterium]|nr:aminotransferase class I/II-fold pyridoxal phosphate-dependent enzyme [Actinomycetes bacterium]